MKTIKGFKLRKLGNEYILVGESMELINFNKMITLNETAAFLCGNGRVRKQIGYFLKEYAPDLCYYDMKKIVGEGEVEM